MAMTIVPPGGFAGFSQMTPASRAALFPRGRSQPRSRRRRKATNGTRSLKGRSSAKRRGKGKRLKFGSPAWQKKYRVGKFAKR